VLIKEGARMDRGLQIKLLKRLLHYVDTGTTALADAPWRNQVSAYTDPERLRHEQDVLFRRHPLLVGFASEWAQPGDYRTDDFAGVPILIARDRDGVLRAFLNVCRHRGAKVVEGCGTARLFTCPYHAWTYELSGRIRGIPDEAAFPGVRAERSGLAPLPLCEKHGLVWVLPSPADDGAATFDIDPWLGGLGPELGAYGLGSYHLYDRRTVNETMNWKILVDTFHEGYHIGFLHRDSLTGILHGNVTDFEPFGPNHRLIFPRRKLERLKAEPEDKWDLMWNTATVYALFPNTLLVTQGDHMEVHRVFPVEGRPDRAVMETGFYVPKAPTSDEERRHWEANLDLVIKVVLTEDFPAGRSMQMGFASGAQKEVVYGRNEPAMIHYHQSLRRALGLPLETSMRAAAE
jgi:phenylpropionate dioxygenase-like ring-hydroxylating dioxygenase large terminal subunit